MSDEAGEATSESAATETAVVETPMTEKPLTEKPGPRPLFPPFAKWTWVVAALIVVLPLAWIIAGLRAP